MHFFKVISFSIFLITIAFLFSCTKNKLNPGCWGECTKGTFYFSQVACDGIKGFLIVKTDQTEDTLTVVGSIPKKYRKGGNGNGLEVCVTFVEVENPQYTMDCNHYNRTVKFSCISKD